MSNLHHLRILDAVAVAGSISGGATRLLISQPAVSKQLKSLQRSLKTTLYHRTPNGIQLTPAGRIAAEHARKIVALSESLPHALADLNSLRSGHLRVAATPTLGTYLLPEVLIRFRKKYPGITLTFDLQPLPLLFHRLSSHDLDFAITDQPAPPAAISRIFAHDDILPIVPTSHALANKRNIPLDRFLAEPLILQDTPEPQPLLPNTPLRPALSLPTLEAIKRAVAAGLGVALLPRFAVRPELASRSLATLTLRQTPKPLPLLELRPSRHPDTKPLIAFAYLLKHAARGSLAPKPPSHLT